MVIEIDLLYGWAVLERRPTMSTNEWLLTSDFWQFLEPWHGRWYEYENCIASCADNIYDLENERCSFGDMIDHVGIYGSTVAEGLSASNVGLVFIIVNPNLGTWGLLGPDACISIYLVWWTHPIIPISYVFITTSDHFKVIVNKKFQRGIGKK